MGAGKLFAASKTVQAFFRDQQLIYRILRNTSVNKLLAGVTGFWLTLASGDSLLICDSQGIQLALWEG